MGDQSIVRDELGFSDWVPRKRTPALPTQTVAQIQRTDKELDEVMRASAGISIEVADFDRAASALSEVEETALKTIEAKQLSTSALGGSELMMRFRELKGLDKAMQTQRRELVNNLVKLSDIDRHLNR